MARVNVEQKALTDPRFYRLGLELGAEAAHAHAAGLFTMIRVWNECIERGKYVLDGWVVQAIVGKTDGAVLIERCDLAVALSGNRFRVRGTKGRVEYLEEKRKLARINGRKGGRPRKPTLVSGKTDVGLPAETPPAPAPAPAPAQEEKTKRILPSVEEVRAYFAEHAPGLDPEGFFAHYEANGWVQSNGQPIKKWKMAVVTWKKNEARYGPRMNGKAPHRSRDQDVLDELRDAQQRPA